MAGNGVDREALAAALDTLDAAFERVAGFDCEALTTPEHLALLGRFERCRRRLPALEHPLINALRRQATPAELGGKLEHAIAEATLISRREAARRIAEAADLGPRHGLTGEPMAPVLEATAAAQRQGRLGAGQVAVIRKFFTQLPGWIDSGTREQVEALLADQGTQFRPDQLAEFAKVLADCLNPDGTYTDADRVCRMWIMLRPSRSSFQTTTVSPGRTYSIRAARPGRSSRAPDMVSENVLVTPAASSAAFC